MCNRIPFFYVHDGVAAIQQPAVGVFNINGELKTVNPSIGVEMAKSQGERSGETEGERGGLL